MSVATTVRYALSLTRVDYEILRHAHTSTSAETARQAHVDPCCLAKAVVLRPSHPIQHAEGLLGLTLLGVEPRTLEKWRREHGLPSKRVGRQRLYLLAEVREWLGGFHDSA